MKRFRSAISGRWVTKLFAREHPSTTVSVSTASTVIHPQPASWTGSYTLKTQCPFCQHTIDANDLVCPFCASELDGENGVPA